MSKEDCINKLRSALGEDFDEEIAERIGNDLEVIEELSLSTEGNLKTFRDLSAQYFKDNQILNRTQAKQKAQNLQKLKQRFGSYVQILDNADPKDRGRMGAKALDAKLSRTILQGEGVGVNVDNIHHELNSKYHSMLQHALLKDEGFVTGNKRFIEYRSGKYDRDIAIELAELEKLNGQPGKSNNTRAMEIAKGINAVQREMLKDMQAAGIDITPLSGRFLKQTHDPARLYAGGDETLAFKKWKEAILPKLNLERTFGIHAADDKAIDEFLFNAFRDIVHGKHDLPDADIADSLIAVNKMGGNKGGKKSRKLHFKGPEDWFEYNQQYGRGGIADTLSIEMNGAARTTSLVRVFGTNPEAGFEADIKRMRSYIKKHGTPDDVANFDRHIEKKMGGTRSTWAEVSGATQAGWDSTIAKIGHAGRAWQNIQLLGKVVLGSLPDIAVGINVTSARTGMNIFETTGSWLTEMGRGFSGANRREFFAEVGLGLEDLFGDVYGRIGADMAAPGRMSDLERIYFMTTFLGPWSNAGRFSTVRVYMRQMVKEAGKSFDQINPRLRASMERFNIGVDDWNIIRKSVSSDENGRQYVLPKDIIANGGDEALSSKVTGLYNDIALLGNPTPSAKNRALFNMGTTQGDVFGQVLRTVSQFKTFAASMHDVVGVVANSNPAMKMNKMSDIIFNKGDTKRFLGLITSLTAMGYASEALRDLAAGKDIPDPRDPEVQKKSFVRGGGGGLMGDFLLSESKKYGKDILDDVIGPAGEMYKDMFELSQDVVFGDEKREGKKAERIKKRTNRMIKRHVIPNHPFVKGPITALHAITVQELLDPEFEKRRERRLQKEQNTFR